jgi:hypothetical protein
VGAATKDGGEVCFGGVELGHALSGVNFDREGHRGAQDQAVAFGFRKPEFPDSGRRPNQAVAGSFLRDLCFLCSTPNEGLRLGHFRRRRKNWAGAEVSDERRIWELLVNVTGSAGSHGPGKRDARNRRQEMPGAP